MNTNTFLKSEFFDESFKLNNVSLVTKLVDLVEVDELNIVDIPGYFTTYDEKTDRELFKKQKGYLGYIKTPKQVLEELRAVILDGTKGGTRWWYYNETLEVRHFSKAVLHYSNSNGTYSFREESISIHEWAPGITVMC